MEIRGVDSQAGRYTEKEREERNSRSDISQERDFMREKKKTHTSRRDKGPLGLQRRDAQDGPQEEEEMNRMVSGGPCGIPDDPGPTVSAYRPSGGLSWCRLCCDISWPFLLPSSGEYSNVLHRNRAAASLNIHVFRVGLHLV